MTGRGLVLFGALLAGCGATGGLPRAAIEHNTAGAEALSVGRLDDAEARFRLALEYHPRFSEPRANLGLVALERGDLEAAEEHLRGALELNEDFAEGWANLGMVLERRGRDGEARRAYERALSIQPGLLDARRDLSRLLIRIGDLPAARAQLMRLVQLTPDDPDTGALLAYAELRLERPAAALARLEPILEKHEDQPTALLVRGLARAHSGDLDGAVADLAGAMEDPFLARQARLRLAAVRAVRGEKAEARRLIAPLLTDAPGDPAVQLIACALQAGDNCP